MGFCCGASGWVKLLDNAPYGGSWDAEYQPLRFGSFTAAKAVHRSGFVACNSGANIDGHVWEECGDGVAASASPFELLKNRMLLWEQPSTRTMPEECTMASTPAGDVVCQVQFDVADGDTLTPSWYEVTHEYTIGDNIGTHYVDVYGFLDEGMLLLVYAVARVCNCLRSPRRVGRLAHRRDVCKTRVSAAGEDDLLLRWGMSEGVGTTLADSSGAASPVAGTLSSDQLWDAGLVRFTEAADTATSDGAVTPAAANTLSAWVYWDGAWPTTASLLPAAAGIGANGPGTAAAANSMYLIFPSGRPTVDFGSVRMSAEAAMSVGEWHHVVVSQGAGAKSTSTTLYVDGEQVGLTLDNVGGVNEPDATPTIAAATFSLAPVAATSATYTAVWTGIISDARVIGHDMQAGAVSALYEATRKKCVHV